MSAADLELQYYLRQALMSATLIRPGDSNSTADTSATASLERSDSHVSKDQEPPPRSCIACTDQDVQLVRPCRSCETDYCVECLVNMFNAAINDETRMPRCCNLIQIHTVLNHLPTSSAESYRSKFEEWITPIKTYCPSPMCSTFIPERRIPSAQNAKSATSLLSVLREVLREVITNVSPSAPARFFQSETDITQLPEYTAVVKHPMHLGTIQEHIASSQYKDTFQLTKDMQLILDNARAYNGAQHPVTTAAIELFTKYLQELSNAVDRLMGTASASATVSLFTCPKCHVAICAACKQLEHAGPCDTSAADYELAMLETFGYKRCPRCKAGVKKMYGCSHMQCSCGAHWCWYCLKSVSECTGVCSGEDYDSELDEDYLSDEEGPEDGEIRGNGDNPSAAPATVPVPAATTAPAPTLATTPAHALATTPANQIVDLDAGGGRRWAEDGYDFGEEPDVAPVISQVWSCKHYFSLYGTPPDDGFNRGDLDRMECNRCFTHITSLKMPPPSKKRRRSTIQPHGVTSPPDGVPGVVTAEKEEAWECLRCRLLVCASCKGKYPVP